MLPNILAIKPRTKIIEPIITLNSMKESWENKKKAYHWEIVKSTSY